MRWAGQMACTGECKNVWQIALGKLKRKRPLGNPKRKWQNDVKTYSEVVWRGRGKGCRIYLALVGDLWRVLAYGTPLRIARVFHELDCTSYDILV